MSKLRIYVEREGERYDVTEAVQVAYDVSVNSLDWGSGFLSTEEAIELRRLAIATGFRFDGYRGSARYGQPDDVAPYPHATLVTPQPPAPAITYIPTIEAEVEALATTTGTVGGTVMLNDDGDDGLEDA